MFYSQTKLNILTYYACCTTTCNRKSQATSDTTEPGILPRQFTTMWTGNTHCYIKLAATSTTRWYQEFTNVLTVYTPRCNPQTSPIEQQSPIRTQNNPLSQNSIPAPEATVPDTPEEKIPKSLNGEGVKNSRKQATTSTTNTQDSRLCFRCK